MSAEDVFIEGISEVRVVLNLSTTGNALNFETGNALRRASVVLLVSHFESFLKEIAIEFIDEIGTGNLEARALPVGVRRLHTLPVLKSIVECGDSAQQQNLFKKIHDVAALWNDSSKPPRNVLKGELLRRQVTSARPDVIDGLFAMMGSSTGVCDGDIDVPLADGTDVVPTSIRLSLEDVIRCRNDIAHGDSSRRPTAEDLERYIQFLATLAGRLQRKATGLAASVVS
ncbi:MAE_28990/MAE_18760 family HEPN-like nuclease [Arthrobacter woluwensis]|uniref:MAE_28990/MAE_18760 family HEPN-like nuclease n=1 Tax=Arthrobacter woluwensis TaxID=156980 RepID=UPI001AAE89C4|nr:MAE_28990/MAE_18760 family HEPN-like nuclease [Arthrobacter woluwensis]QTF73310.1 hypothetical protein G8758_15820 [Arthrobacter woluwensis]